MSKLVVKAVKAIIRDLAGRSGLGNEWEQIDKEIQEEIEREWQRIVEKSK